MCNAYAYLGTSVKCHSLLKGKNPNIDYLLHFSRVVTGISSVALDGISNAG